MEKSNRDEVFKKNVNITIESWPKTSKDEIIFPKQNVNLSGMANISDDIINAVKKAVIEKAPKRPEDKLGLYRVDDNKVGVQKCEGTGLENIILGRRVVPGESLSYLGEAKIEVNVLCENPDQEFLPNGDTYADLKNYSWDDFERLQKAAQEEDQKQFAEAVSLISAKDDCLSND